LRKTCFAITLDSASPLALAVLTKSPLPASMKPALVTLAIVAIEAKERVSAGRTRYLREPPPKPDGGRSRSLIEKRYISISPSQKTGMETPARERAISGLPSRSYLLHVESIPAKTPPVTASSIALEARRRVRGNLSAMLSDTGLPVTNDLPRSNRASRPR